MIRDLRTALSIIGKEYRFRFAVLVSIALVASGFEVVGAALIYLLLALITDPDAPITAPIVGDVTSVLPLERPQLLMVVVASIAGFLVIRSAFTILDAYVQTRIIQRMAARLSSRVLSGYLALPYAFHLQRGSPELLRNAGAVARSIATGLLSSFVAVTAESTLLLGLTALLFSVSPPATAIAILVLGTAAAVVTRVIQPRLVELGRVSHLEAKAANKAIIQSLQGIRDVRVLGVERAFARQYERSVLRSASAMISRTVVSRLPSIVVEVALVGFILGFFALTIGDDASSRRILPVLGLFAYAGRRIQPAIKTIISTVNELSASHVALNELQADLRLIGERSIDTGPVPPLPFRGEIRLEDVAFRYEGTERDALTSVDLVIRRGETIGICGATGGGKTTLVDVITGLLSPTVGRVTVDGVDIAGRERAWQRSLGIVPQSVFLTDDSLRENIALGARRKEIDEARLREAIELAQLAEFIDSLPRGLGTVVGERGVRISGGQRQRIAIARALYRRPELLVFDEGTSALDNITERDLMAALAGLRGTHTVIMVAHRLSTIRDADRIVLVEGGRIAGVGPYDELLASNEAFRRLAAPAA